VSVDVCKRIESDEGFDKLVSSSSYRWAGTSRPACKKVIGKDNDLTYAASTIPNRPDVLSFFRPSIAGSKRTIHSSPPI
jgi:hypothetical protein